MIEQRLRRELEGDVLFDAATRARYSTDASIYQITPLGVVRPRHTADVEATLSAVREAGCSLTPRGGGTSQGGQCIGDGVIIDFSRYMNAIENLDAENARCTVQPGIVLDELNRELRSHGLFFPVDVSTANRATIGGMAGNNSAGTRSIRYGMMADNVSGVQALLADGSAVTFAEESGGPHAASMMSLYDGLEAELSSRIPNVMRHVAGYNLHRLGRQRPNPAEVLVGSEGTLGVFTSVTLELARPPSHTVLGVAHFDTVRQAMDAAQHIVTLQPVAVELVDHTLIRLARDIPEFQPLIKQFVSGDPAALLLVEFAGEDQGALRGDLERLTTLLADHGLSHSVHQATDRAAQSRVWSVRKAGLNIVMSMKGDEKPVSFIEDCTVPLDRLADYHDRLSEVFRNNGTSGTWYAHASVGCLHVRPALNLKTAEGAVAMRAIAEQAHEIVREFNGSVSGEHGDGLVRSEFIEPMLGTPIARGFAELKKQFDPERILNPGKIVDPVAMDDRRLFRYPPGYSEVERQDELTWKEWGGLLGAVEMCNNNGACRKHFDGSMCPSYRVTRNEVDTTRGRANTLRMALTGQLGTHGLASREVKDALDLCVGCKACRRECPTGVDMARMKIESLAAHRSEHGTPARDWLLAHLPRAAPVVSRFPRLANMRNRSALLRNLLDRTLKLSHARDLPEWSRKPFRESGLFGPTDGNEVVLFVDTFNRYFEPDNVRAAVRVLTSGGYRVHIPLPAHGSRPLCCGRTYLNAGMVDHARAEMQRTLDALDSSNPSAPIVGLEPSCLLTFRDEMAAVLPDVGSLARRAVMFEEFLALEVKEGRWSGPKSDRPPTPALLHGHCHQKAFGVAGRMATVLETMTGTQAEMIESSCCGMAGSFGYETEHFDASIAMAELSLAPQVRNAPEETVLIADGVSCRHQIAHTTGRQPVHLARYLADALSLDG